MRGLYNRCEVAVEKTERRGIVARSIPWWRVAFVCVVISSLALTLATRAFGGINSLSIVVQSSSPRAGRQHMDREAAPWAAPVTKMVVVRAPTFYTRAAPTDPPLPTLFLEENLCNRPPPLC